MGILIRLLFWTVFSGVIMTKNITMADWQFWALVVLISIFAHIM